MSAAGAWRIGEVRLEIHPDRAGNMARFVLRPYRVVRLGSSARQQRPAVAPNRVKRPALQQRSTRLVYGSSAGPRSPSGSGSEKLARATARVSRRR